MLQVEQDALRGLQGPGQSDTGVYQIDLRAEGVYEDTRTDVPHWDGRYHYLLRDLDDGHIAPGWLFPYVDRLLVDQKIKVRNAEGEEQEKEGVALFRGDNSASWWEKQGDSYKRPPGNMMHNWEWDMANWQD